jgi:hypothetical protein
MKQGCVATILELAMLSLAVALVLGATRGPGFSGTRVLERRQDHVGEISQASHRVPGKILRSVGLFAR